MFRAQSSILPSTSINQPVNHKSFVGKKSNFKESIMKVVTLKNLEEIFLVGHLVLTLSISMKTAMGLGMPYYVGYYQ
jgi:endoglucanase Acf2